jgi:UDP-N-acetylmuramoyl-tripeptide--D-alanyl-D-alanine ligase
MRTPILKLSEVAVWMNAELIGEEGTFEGVNTDTRLITDGNLFVAIPGGKVDGHSFIEAAYEQGARAAIISDPNYGGLSKKLSLLKVEDTVLALGKLARRYRQQFTAQMVAVTGSCGKTTVKEMLARILMAAGPTLASQGNFNTEIGVPLSLLQLNSEHQYAVIEMGARKKGDIHYLMELVQPQVALITNAGVAHLEIFGSERGIAEAKGEIFSYLKPEGTAIINADDPNASYWKSLLTTQQCYTFGMDQSADFSARNIKKTENGSLFELQTPQGIISIHLKAPGNHSVSNALAAAAASYAMGISISDIQQGLEQFLPVAGRLQLKQGRQDCRIIDDTYNANPVSVRAALKVLASQSGKKIFVMGDMFELGPDAIRLHREIGVEAYRLGIDKMVGVGTLTVAAIEGFGGRATHYPDKTVLIQALLPELTAETTVLIKGSRGMRMEDVVYAFINQDTIRAGHPC